MFIKNKDGKYVYKIALNNNDEILKFVNITRSIEDDIILTGRDKNVECQVSAKSLLGTIYAAVLDNLYCISNINISGEIAKFIVEEN